MLGLLVPVHHRLGHFVNALLGPIRDVTSTSLHSLLVIDSRVWLLGEHWRCDLLLLVGEERSLQLVDAVVGSELELSLGS